MITWESKKEQIFEMPTGGAAIMRQGPNLLKLARKEQCLALLTQLRTKFKIDGFIYRVFPNGEVQYLHPKVRREWEGKGWRWEPARSLVKGPSMAVEVATQLGLRRALRHVVTGCGRCRVWLEARRDMCS